jgi:hypothetical protein
MRICGTETGEAPLAHTIIIARKPSKGFCYRVDARLRPQTERSKRVNLRLVSAAIVLVLSGILLGAGVYESVVLAPNLQGAPTSLEHARGFYHLTNPGVFFRLVSPATQLFLVVALVGNWKSQATR